MITVNVLGHETVQVEKGTTLYALSQKYPCERPTLVAKVDNELKDLQRELLYDCTVEFLDISDTSGFRVYQRSVSFLMVYAIKKVLENSRVVIAHSINKNYYCELPEYNEPITEELLKKIEFTMKEAVEKNLPIEKHTLPIETAARIATDLGMMDKMEMLKYRRTSTVNFYSVDGFYDYFYGQMAPNTGCLGAFKLTPRSKGF